jgi:glutamate formiminotransferase
MTIKVWLEMAAQDAERRGLPSLRPLLESLARSTSALRSAEWNPDAGGTGAEAQAGIDAR